MKKQVTRAVLCKYRLKVMSSAIKIMAFILLFALVSFAIVPFPVGTVMGTVCCILALIVYLKARKEEQPGKIKKAYIRMTPLVRKKVSEDGVSDENGDPGGVSFYFYFESDGRVEVTNYKTYRNGTEGKLYLVAYYSENNKPFACFDADLYEPGDGIELRL
jgi:hypothetical protein